MSKIINSKEVHCEELEEIVSKSPCWLVRHGTLIIIICFLLLIFGAYISYPEIMTAFRKR